VQTVRFHGTDCLSIALTFPPTWLQIDVRVKED
jgi:hypothetical protein